MIDDGTKKNWIGKIKQISFIHSLRQKGNERKKNMRAETNRNA